MSTKVSPLAPAAFPALVPVAGVRFAAASTGLRYSGRPDLMVAEVPAGSPVAGVFTRSKTRSAPVDWCREALKGGSARVIVVNSGNANAFTGKAGVAAVEATAAGAAETFGCGENEVFIASTGTIGVPLDASKIVAKLPEAKAALSAEAWEAAARAIMTTDTFPKAASVVTEIGGVPVTIAGFGKGSGMIQPDMATTLNFVFTDADLPAPVLQELLKAGADKSYNCITVDSDTSTSDTLLLVATRKAGNAPVAKASDPALRKFRKALDGLLIDLAQQIVKDGEGASKFVTIAVSGAASAAAARRIGLAIANSPLVKTAIAGEDANWGRIIAAVGKSGETADRDRLTIAIGGVPVAAEGQAVPGYDETPVAAHFKGRYIDIAVDVGVGRGKATVWTCDLTHDYISINADYRS
ncbi:Arginine biosynthesis bifunctional protein ArgJ (Includes: Glutamate N-acetyltransferase; Amino-acid acetyltransferase) [uncultured Alphaproteobacteria bacterium]|uniref:Arginine biosynthesis bifunctional protein ArgJ n=1 Tax=uncultured Alphaproteobacteria bacterium TaxID=91750 RepID=A0A212K1K5_9PROT|nr:Arginine biosynthesis bifunctional protein ArgJ (Includes: Glutamate N-acetyltransferase; Amino-acid acetyltransferase) [uncultured Alphaproteobacteria bacterium]